MTQLQWTDVLAADALRPGEVREIDCRGSDLLLVRTESRTLYAIDAWCPHQRNYMPNGRVPGSPLSSLLHGEDIVCPFHGWRFDPSGRCTAVPPAQRVPAVLTRGERIMGCWEVRERGGRILVAPAQTEDSQEQD